ncbi:MAG: HAD family phosphatase [Synergistaceae bacterium]|nr:HAD family phosphatase [Synergistaceae bacterium]
MTKLIAFDLDFTLLDTKKNVSPENLRVLAKAASLGIEIVPVTGRVWSAVPEAVKGMKFVRYAVTLNGAEIYDVRNAKVLGRCLLPLERAVTLARVFEDLGVVYDFIAEGQGWMRRELYDRIESVSDGEWQTNIMKTSRKPVDDFFGKMNEYPDGVQKMQIYTRDKDLRANLLNALPVVFPHALFTSSVPNNIEINDPSANKGEGLKFIAEYLKIPMTATMAFGDGLNDLEMIRSAGIGVAMGNACTELLEIADHVTSDCDHDGVAEGIKTFCRGIDD